LKSLVTNGYRELNHLQNAVENRSGQMKVAVLGGTGMVGSRIVAELAARGHQVTSVSRQQAAAYPDGVLAITADATDPVAVAALAATQDVVVSAIGPSREPGGDPGSFAGTLTALAEAVSPTRLAVVGGAGSLLAAPGVRLIDTPEFPELYKAEAVAAADSLQALIALGLTSQWTYLSPAPVIAPGERTGSYRTADDSPAGDFISAEDFAVAMVDEIETPTHDGRRFTVAH
jgi:putative NADH-flavin reductase